MSEFTWHDGFSVSNGPDVAPGCVIGIRSWSLNGILNVMTIMESMKNGTFPRARGEDASIRAGDEFTASWYAARKLRVPPPAALQGRHQGVWLPAAGSAPREHTASCSSMFSYWRDHTVPWSPCGCGFWAYWKDREIMLWGSHTVAGMIMGYGRVISGTRGFRCEKARILALAWRPGAEMKARHAVAVRHILADAHRVPVYRSVRSMMRDFPAGRHDVLPPGPGPARWWRTSMLQPAARPRPVPAGREAADERVQ